MGLGFLFVEAVLGLCLQSTHRKPEGTGNRKGPFVQDLTYIATLMKRYDYRFSTPYRNL